MKRIWLLTIILAALVASANIFVYQNKTSPLTPNLEEEVLPREILKKVPEAIPEVINEIEEPEREVISSEPLVVKDLKTYTDIPKLTKFSVFVWTNIQRVANGGGEFKENNVLDTIARLRLEDMFNRQYFAHISPLGVGVGDLADQEGYQFISIGENIARGDFSNDQDLVRAWMDSPGHRANILNPRFTEIGIAVQASLWQDRETWIGVQVFAKPSIACPTLDEILAQNINTNKELIEDLAAQANQLAEYLDSQSPQTREEANEYNQKVEEYNNLVARINALIAETKNMISAYNQQVEIFNLCVSE